MLISLALALAAAMALQDAPAATAKGTYKGCQAWVWEVAKGRSVDINTDPFAPAQFLRATQTGEHVVQLRVRFKRNHAPADGDCAAVDCHEVKLIGHDGQEYSPIETEAPNDSCRRPVHFDIKGIEGFPRFYFSVPEQADAKKMHLRLANERLLLKK